MPTDEALLAKILAESATTQIANSLGMDPTEYAKRVLHYAKNPKADVQVTVLSPAEEKAAGIPSVDDAMAFVDGMLSGAIPVGDEHARTRFAGNDSAEKKSMTAAGSAARRGPAEAPPLPGEPPRR
ncbi:MAG: hypothetical protein FJ137_06365 [Deltaproteobacteria bacterium]|nr:hypothetical protein [Deltaproteobacteria bacterium]